MVRNSEQLLRFVERLEADCALLREAVTGLEMRTDRRPKWCPHCTRGFVTSRELGEHIVEDHPFKKE